ncbi:MAG: T9SS type A sorting domain-containing protein [Brumimicrobium sp.]|nr:T9SS type A sorting domain-containing protein [Brumimicrobium sp.]
MKQLYFIFLLTFLGNVSFAQTDIVILDNNYQPYNTADTTFIEGFGVNIDQPFYVKNIGTTTDFIFYRKVIMNSNSFGVTFCDNQVCYPATNPGLNSGISQTIATGDTSLYKPSMFTNGEESGFAVAKYYIAQTTLNNIIDSITVKFTVIPDESSIAKNTKVGLSIYPNPAQTEIMVQGEDFKNGGTLIFLDALGKEVKRNMLTGVNTKVSLTSLNKGLYFVYLIDNDGVRSQTQRLIVK